MFLFFGAGNLTNSMFVDEFDKRVKNNKILCIDLLCTLNCTVVFGGNSNCVIFVVVH